MTDARQDAIDAALYRAVALTLALPAAQVTGELRRAGVEAGLAYLVAQAARILLNDWPP